MRCWSPASGSPRPGQARVRIGEGTFLNLGVMVASTALVEIGAHCMLANGCFVTDGNHRFDDPRHADHLAGLHVEGADAHRRQHLAAAPTSSSPAA